MNSQIAKVFRFIKTLVKKKGKQKIVMNENIIISYLKRCRMCLMSFEEDDKHVQITKDIEERFLIITQIEVS